MVSRKMNLSSLPPAGVMFFITEEEEWKLGITDSIPEKLGPYLYYFDSESYAENFVNKNADKKSFDYFAERKFIIYEGKELEFYDYQVDKILSNEEGEDKYPWLYL